MILYRRKNSFSSRCGKKKEEEEEKKENRSLNFHTKSIHQSHQSVKTESTAKNIPTLTWSSHRGVDIFQRVAYHFPHAMLIPGGFPSGCFIVETCPVRASSIGGPR